MIAVDTNILVYAHRADSEWHKVALDKVLSLARGTSRWAIPWPCVHEFLAICTHPR
jgi:predicted nucleic acid-binding protein